MDELKEFFNALDLDKLLQALMGALADLGHEYAGDFRDKMEQFLRSKEKSAAAPMACVWNLSALRENIAKIKKLGPERDVSIFGYSWNADFQMEDYLFVVLGEFLSATDRPLRVSG